MNSICWAPYELGLILACASSDGTVSLIEYKADGTWETTKVRLGSPGVRALRRYAAEGGVSARCGRCGAPTSDMSVQPRAWAGDGMPQSQAHG